MPIGPLVGLDCGKPFRCRGDPGLGGVVWDGMVGRSLLGRLGGKGRKWEERRGRGRVALGTVGGGVGECALGEVKERVKKKIDFWKDRSRLSYYQITPI